MNAYKISQGAVISLTRSRCTVATLEVGKVQYYEYLLKCDFFFLIIVFSRESLVKFKNLILKFNVKLSPLHA